MDKNNCPLCGKQAFDNEETCMICDSPLDETKAISAAGSPKATGKKLNKKILIPIIIAVLAAVGVAVFFAVNNSPSNHTDPDINANVEETVYDDEYYGDDYYDDGYYDEEYYEDDGYIDDSYDDSYYEPYYYPRITGYTLGELEEAMLQYLSYSEDLTPYMIPGYESIIDRMIEIESNLHYDNYAEWLSRSNFTDFRYLCDSYTYGIFWEGYGIYYNESTDLYAIDEIYRNNTGTGLCGIVKQAFSEHYGYNLTLNSVTVMEVYFASEYEDFTLRVFLIETDTGYFFLFDY